MGVPLLLCQPCWISSTRFPGSCRVGMRISESENSDHQFLWYAGLLRFHRVPQESQIVIQNVLRIHQHYRAWQQHENSLHPHGPTVLSVNSERLSRTLYAENCYCAFRVDDRPVLTNRWRYAAWVSDKNHSQVDFGDGKITVQQRNLVYDFHMHILAVLRYFWRSLDNGRVKCIWHPRRDPVTFEAKQ